MKDNEGDGGPIVQGVPALAPAAKTTGRSYCSKTVLIGLAVVVVLLIAGGVGTAVYVLTSNSSAASSSSSTNNDGSSNSQVTSVPTRSPITSKPTLPTKSPTTAKPTTRSPTVKTKSPTTSAPTTMKPTVASKSPTTGVPTTTKPTTKSPTSSAPTTKSPTTKSPTTPPPIAVPTNLPTSNPATKFDITLVPLTTMSASAQAAFAQAKARWEQVITQDMASTVYISAGQQICGQPAPTTDVAVDDILIYAEIKPIDGPGQILGSAGPCGFLNGQVRLGKMTFDSADIDLMTTQGTLNSVILHEMGHVLGIGTMWDTRNLIDPSTVTTNIQYYGTQGNIGNTEIGRTGNAIIEDVGGSGTARGHWKETIYTNELMTGYISGTSQPMSRLTVRALVDLGYQGVDVTKADAFAVSSSGRRRRLRRNDNKEFDGPEFHMGDDIYKGPVHYFDEKDAVAKPGREEDFRRFKEEHAHRIKNKTRENDKL